MYSLLIVDDEQYAVDALVKTVDWKSLSIDEVYSSNYIDETINMLLEKKVDLLLCDISMPEKSGFEIVKFINENNLNTRVIMLTAYANFEYAQEAVNLGVVDYLLKPVKTDMLAKAVNKAIAQIEEENQQALTVELYEKGYELWEKNVKFIIERFWQDVFAGRIYLDENKLAQLSKNSGCHVGQYSAFQIVLISLDEWNDNEFEEEILDYALRNIAEEVILGDLNGNVIQDFNRNNMCVIYCDDMETGESINKIIEERCRKFICYCNMYLKVKLCCYVSTLADTRGVVNEYNSLLKLYQNNLTETDTVIKQGEHEYEPANVWMPPFLSTANPLENVAKEQMVREIDEFFSQSGKNLPEWNNMIASGLTFFIYDICNKRGINASDIVDLSLSYKMLNSAERLKKWCLSIVERVMTADSEDGKNNKIMEVKRYIETHYKTNITRETIANDLFFNGSYLSRFFKQNTGMSIFEYLCQVRINEAKRLLLYTDKKISTIVLEVGYNHFSHFANIFKKYTGMTPKKYRELNKASGIEGNRK